MRLLGRNKKSSSESISVAAPKPQQPKKAGFFSKKNAPEKDAVKKEVEKKEVEKKPKSGIFQAKPKPEGSDSKKGLFRRSSRSVKAPAPAKDAVEEARDETPAEVAPAPVAAPEQVATTTTTSPVKEEVPPQPESTSAKSPEPVVPETVHSEQDDDADDATQPNSPMASPKAADTPTADERRNEADDDDKDDEESPESRLEQGEREKPSSPRDGAERKMSVEEPAEEGTGLLCGCI